MTPSTAPVDVALATPSELPGVLRLLAVQLAEHSIILSESTLRQALARLIATPVLGHVLVARQGGELVGVAVLIFTWTLEHGGAVAWLEELYVVPERRGIGIGESLLRRAVAAAEAAGCAAVELEVDTQHARAEHLYAREGFGPLPRRRWSRRLAGPPRADLIRAAPEAVDHLSLGVNDLARSKAFYDAVLGTLGFAPRLEIPGEVGYFRTDDAHHKRAFALFIGFEEPGARREVLPSAGFHIAFRAPSRAAVDDFHRAALAAGGRDYGAPGLRPQYHPSYYGAFVLDPDGHHVEAVCHD